MTPLPFGHLPSPGEKAKKISKLIILTGPTASGKTALAIKLAKKFQGEIISADSRQVYRGMNIGTAKPTPSPLQGEGWGEVLVKGIRHHLLNIRNPNQSYTLAHFQRDAAKTIKQIQKRGRVPFLVGGTALYINALINNLQIPEVKPNPKLRRKLEKLTTTQLFKLLKAKDPARARAIDPHNPRRLIRALEIIENLGKVPSLGVGRVPEGRERSFLLLGLKKSSPALRRAINKRTKAMFQAGLVREVEKLIQRYSPRLPAFDAIGYREVIEYLEGKSTLQKAKEAIQSHTWQFTRRQLTWFKKLPVVWIKSPKAAEKAINQFLRT